MQKSAHYSIFKFTNWFICNNFSLYFTSFPRDSEMNVLEKWDLGEVQLRLENEKFNYFSFILQMKKHAVSDLLIQKAISIPEIKGSKSHLQLLLSVRIPIKSLNLKELDISTNNLEKCCWVFNVNLIYTKNCSNKHQRLLVPSLLIQPYGIKSLG